jgi:hypothetical protein
MSKGSDLLVSALANEGVDRDVPIDYSENVRVLGEELKQRVNEIELA